MSPLAEQILALHHNEALSMKQIAERLGCSKVRVHQVLRDAGIARSVGRTMAAKTGDNLGDPKRADKLLRRFSWETAE